MAARAPASISQYINLGKMTPKRQILTTEPTQAIDDQHFSLLRHSVLLSDSFRMRTTTANTWTVIGRYYIPGQHRCGAAGASETGEAYILAWSTPSVAFDVGIYDATGAHWHSTSVAASTVPVWRGPISLDFLPTDGTELEIQLGCQRTGGAVNGVYVAGIVIYSG